MYIEDIIINIKSVLISLGHFKTNFLNLNFDCHKIYYNSVYPYPKLIANLLYEVVCSKEHVPY